MTLTVTDTPPVHPPRRRTIEGNVDGYKVRAIAIAHYDPVANEFGPFELTDNISISRNSLTVLAAKASEVQTILTIVSNVAAVAATGEESTA